MRTLRRALTVIALLILGTTDGLAEAAVAVGQSNGNWFYRAIWNATTQARAIDEVLAGCRRDGLACVVHTKFSKYCFAVAFNNRGAMQFGQGSTIAKAKADALKLCRSKYSGSCHIDGAFCDTINEGALKVEQQAREREYNEAKENWQGCNDGDDNACIRALTYSGLSAPDRDYLERRREAIVAERVAAVRQAAEAEERRLKAERQRREEAARELAEQQAAEQRARDEAARLALEQSQKALREQQEQAAALQRQRALDEQTQLLVKSCWAGDLASCDAALQLPHNAELRSDLEDIRRTVAAGKEAMIAP